MGGVVCPSFKRETTDELGSDPSQLDGIQGQGPQQLAKLTDEDVTRIGGRRKELAGRLQARYGFAKAEAEREIEAWMKAQRNAA